MRRAFFNQPWRSKTDVCERFVPHKVEQAVTVSVVDIDDPKRSKSCGRSFRVWYSYSSDFPFRDRGKHSRLPAYGFDPGKVPGSSGNGFTESAGRATRGGGEAQQTYWNRETLIVKIGAIDCGAVA